MLYAETYLMGCGAKKIVKKGFNSTFLACAFYPSIVINQWPYKPCDDVRCQSSCTKKSSSFKDLCGNFYNFTGIKLKRSIVIINCLFLF